MPMVIIVLSNIIGALTTRYIYKKYKPKMVEIREKD